MAILIAEGSRLEAEINMMKKTNQEMMEKAKPYQIRWDRCTNISTGMYILVFILVWIMFITLYLGNIFLFFFLLVITVVILYYSTLITKNGEKKYGINARKFYKNMYWKGEIDAKESGYIGEQETLKELLNLNSKYQIIYGIPIDCMNINQRNRKCEIDFMVFGPNGIFIIENKYMNGLFEGNAKYDRDFKRDKRGNYGETLPPGKERNPVRQVLRQMSILKDLLTKNNINCFINPIAYFSDPDAELNIQNDTKAKILLAGEDDIVSYIENFHGISVNSFLSERILMFMKEYLDNNKSASLD